MNAFKASLCFIRPRVDVKKTFIHSGKETVFTGMKMIFVFMKDYVCGSWAEMYVKCWLCVWVGGYVCDWFCVCVCVYVDCVCVLIFFF